MRIFDAIKKSESPDLVALDISAGRIKLLALSGQAGCYHINAFAIEPLPDHAFSEHQIADPGAISQAIRRLMQRASCKSSHAVIAVSGSAVISKIVDMPASLSEDDLEQQLSYEADSYIPYPIEDVSLDFQILGPSEQGAELQSVLLAACRREMVDMYITAVQMAGLEPRVVDVESYALQNACSLLLDQQPDRGEGQIQGVVNLGGSKTAVNILHDGETIFTIEQPFGGAQLVEELQRHADLNDTQTALERLRNRHFDDEFRIQALPRFAHQAAQQIDRALQLFYSSSSQHAYVDQILLTGGGAVLPEIHSGISDQLNVPVAMADPLAGMSISEPARRNGVENEAPLLMVATGLALRAFH